MTPVEITDQLALDTNSSVKELLKMCGVMQASIADLQRTANDHEKETKMIQHEIAKLKLQGMKQLGFLSGVGATCGLIGAAIFKVGALLVAR